MSSIARGVSYLSERVLNGMIPLDAEFWSRRS